MNKTVASLALLKVNWDTNTQRKDFIENFVPFIATLINRKNYKTVNVNTICKDFETEYGLIIPYHPMLAILTRAMKGGYIVKRHNGDYVPVKEKMVAADFTDVALEQERKYKKVLERFLKFCQENYGETLSEAEAESAFVSFLKDHDLDVLFISQGLGTLLPAASASTTHKYLINSFIKDTYESDPEIFAFVVDISVGHIIANTLLCRDFDKFEGELSGCNFYLDIGFLFNIMGINGIEKREAYTDFVQLLTSHEASLFVFRHTFDEFMGILEGCMQWVESAYFDITRASRTAIYFVENQFTASDVEQFILGVSGKLSVLNIRVVDVPAPLKHVEHQIDEGVLTSLIVDIYKSNVPYFDETQKEFTIYKDVKSISAIYKFRTGDKPNKLQDAKHIFVTTNSSLALASRLFEIQSTEEKYFFIPAALTDVFVGTLIWLQSPTNVAQANEKRLIANCYAALQPTKPMVKRLTETADRLRSEGVITDEDVTLLKQSRVARNLLQEETLGDPNRFTDKTVAEILDEIKAGIRKEEQEKLRQDREAVHAREKMLVAGIDHERQRTQNEKQKHVQTQEELTRVQIEKDKIEININMIAERVASVITIVFYVFSSIVVVIVSVFQFYPDILGNNKTLNFVLIFVAIALSVLIVITGFNIHGVGQRLKTWLRRVLVNFLRGR